MWTTEINVNAAKEAKNNPCLRTLVQENCKKIFSDYLNLACVFNKDNMHKKVYVNAAKKAESNVCLQM